MFLAESWKTEDEKGLKIYLIRLRFFFILLSFATICDTSCI